jgi:hypothetical protein
MEQAQGRITIGLALPFAILAPAFDLFANKTHIRADANMWDSTGSD